MTKTYNYRGETLTLDAATQSTLPGSFAQLSDGCVHYELVGAPTAEVVVLVHGFSAPCITWDMALAELAKAGLHVLRYDLYGRGYSDRPNVVYDQNLFDRQLDELLSKLGLNDPVNLIGLSMGGAVVTTFAARHPERIRRLGLIDPLVNAPDTSPLVKMLFATRIGEFVMDWFGDQILAGGQAQDFYNHTLVADFQTKYRIPMKYRGFRQAILSTMRSMPTWKITEAYEQVGKANYPVLLIWGRKDKTVPFETHRQVQALIPRVEFHAIDGAAHVPHLDQPQVVNQLLIEFLKE